MAARIEFLEELSKRRVCMMDLTECRKKMLDLGAEAKGIHGQVAVVDKEMDDLLARLTSLSAERDRLAARHESLNDELESVEEEHDRLQRKERRRARRLATKKRVHETLQLGPSEEVNDAEELVAIAERFVPEGKKKNRIDSAEKSVEPIRATA